MAMKIFWPFGNYRIEEYKKEEQLLLFSYFDNYDF